MFGRVFGKIQITCNYFHRGFSFAEGAFIILPTKRYEEMRKTHNKSLESSKSGDIIGKSTFLISSYNTLGKMESQI